MRDQVSLKQTTTVL